MLKRFIRHACLVWEHEIHSPSWWWQPVQWEELLCWKHVNPIRIQNDFWWERYPLKQQVLCWCHDLWHNCTFKVLSWTTNLFAASLWAEWGLQLQTAGGQQWQNTATLLDRDESGTNQQRDWSGQTDRRSAVRRKLYGHTSLRRTNELNVSMQCWLT